MKLETVEKCLSLAAAIAAIISALIMSQQFMNQARGVSGAAVEQCEKK